MKSILVFLLSLASVVLIACSTPPKLPTADEARVALTQMDDGLTKAASECTVAAQALSDSKAGADLHDVCVNALIPARDAVHFAGEAASPWWSPGATQKIVCAGKATVASLTTLCQKVKCSTAIQDALAIASDVAKAADNTCDPAHPTTQVTVSIDSDVARVEPSYPAPVR